MSLRKSLTVVSLTLGLICAFSAVAFGQQPTTPDNGQQQRQWGRGGGGGGNRRGMGGEGQGMMRVLEQLNLTDAQKQQVKSIEDKLQADTKSQREELRSLRESNQGGTPSADTQSRMQTLRSQIEAANKTAHDAIMNVLTSDQRTQLEQLMKERRERQGDRRDNRPNQPNNQPNNP